ncbi:MAG: hypothetical protein ACR2ND_14985 [Solirubrobacteraceae bacterium]
MDVVQLDQPAPSCCNRRGRLGHRRQTADEERQELPAYAGLGILGSIFTFAPSGVTLFYLPVIFLYPAAVWFGAWAAVGGFFGNGFSISVQ